MSRRRLTNFLDSLSFWLMLLAMVGLLPLGGPRVDTVAGPALVAAHAPMEMPTLPDESESPTGEEGRSPTEEHSNRIDGVVRSDGRRVMTLYGATGKLPTPATMSYSLPSGRAPVSVDCSEHAERFGLGAPLRI